MPTRPKRVNVEGPERLPAFSHASIAGGLVFVSGTLGTKPGTFELAEGGVGPHFRMVAELSDVIRRSEG